MPLWFQESMILLILEVRDLSSVDSAYDAFRLVKTMIPEANMDLLDLLWRDILAGHQV